MQDIIKAPVLFIGFNRPDVTIESFRCIKAAKPAKLYVAIDGPRDYKLGEEQLCKEVLEITKQVDWECEAKYLIRDTNLGCKIGVTSAISWALEMEDRIIIIEDDILAVPSFFTFAEELLEKYKNDSRICMISANQYTPIEMEDDYLFSNYGHHIWGWATWKRAWDDFDVNLPYLKNDIENENNLGIGLNKKRQQSLLKLGKYIFKVLKNNSINTWDYQFAYHIERNQMLSIVPRLNLASNIGIKSSRTESNSKINRNYYPAESNFSLLKHPAIVESNNFYDEHHLKFHVNRKDSLLKRVLSKIMIFKRLKSIVIRFFKNNYIMLFLLIL